MFDRLLKPFRPALRMAQTSLAMQKAGLKWWLKGTPAPELLRETMEELGATYIKLGQLVASSPSLFPPDYVEAFQRCLDQTPAQPFHAIEEVLREELGDGWRSLFQHVETTPLGSASIAQVHAAVLSGGEEVVIKVQKPGLEQLIETDFQFMQFAAWMLELLSPRSFEGAVQGIVEEIRNSMLEECDFVREAANIASYQRFLDAFEIRSVRVPRTYPHASTRRVLTMERFHGVPLSDIEGVKRYSLDPEQTLVDALNVWFMSLSECQIYHADLHAGNVMVLTDGRVGFIDFGIVGRISPEVWAALLSLAQSLPVGDFHAIAQALVTMGATHHAVRVDEFAADIQALMEKLTQTTGELDSVLADFTLSLSRLSRRHGVRFPREFTLLLKQFLYFDRYLRILAPELDVTGDERLVLSGLFQ